MFQFHQNLSTKKFQNTKWAHMSRKYVNRRLNYIFFFNFRAFTKFYNYTNIKLI